MLRVGRIDYLNADPLFTRFPRTGVEVVHAVPSQLNAWLREGALDVATVSSIEYARAAGRYLLVPEVGIAASGAIRSVLLLSPAPLGELNGCTFYLSTASATTAVLLRILLARRYRVQARFEPWDLEAGLPPGPLMLIGDPALTVPAQPTHPVVLDLCAEWVAFTGLPMTFALVCVRREAAVADSAGVAALARAFQSAARDWPEPLEQVLATAGDRVRLPAEELRSYLLALEFRQTPRHLAGLEQYFCLAAELEELEAPPRLQFLAE